MNLYNKVLALATVSMLAAGCKKSYLDTNPSNAITDATLYTTAAGCRSVLDGMARNMNTNQASFTLDGVTTAQSASDWGEKSIDLMDDCLGQDVLCYGGGYDWYFTDAYQWTGPTTSGNQMSSTAWYLYYKLINDANLILANIHQAEATSDANELNEIKGEAYAYRAWSYYKLSLYYSKTYVGNTTAPGVPIYTTPTTASTKGNPRGTVADVYNRIKIDIDSAVTLISNSGVSTPYGGNKSYVSLATTYGMYAEIAQVMQDWTNATKYADLAIDAMGGAGSLMDSVSYLGGFNSASNSEWMWASQMTSAQMKTMSIQSFMSFVDVNAPGYCNYITYRRGPAYFLSLIPATDVRRRCFDSKKNQTKFHLANAGDWQADMLYMRLAEMFLIKAEAQAHVASEADAIATLETLVQKRNSGYTYAATPYFKTTVPSGSTKLLEEIYLQRRIELYLEGFSFRDLKRLGRDLNRPSGSGNFDIATCKVLTVPASSNAWQFKLSQKEMDNNKSFTGADQNP